VKIAFNFLNGTYPPYFFLRYPVYIMYYDKNKCSKHKNIWNVKRFAFVACCFDDFSNGYSLLKIRHIRIIYEWFQRMNARTFDTCILHYCDQPIMCLNIEAFILRLKLQNPSTKKWLFFDKKVKISAYI